VVGLFVRLKVRLVIGGLRRNTGRTIGLVLGLTAAVLVGSLAAIGLAVLRRDPAEAAEISGGVFTALVVGWAFVPLLTFASDETLDPARFGLLPLRRKELIIGLYVSAFLGVPAVMSLLIVTGAAVAGASTAVVAPVAVAASGVELALCIAVSRALGSAFSGLLRSRRGRDLAILLGMGVAATAQFLNLALQRIGRSHGGGAIVDRVSAALRWTPPGMLGHAAHDAATGRWPLALGEVAVGAMTVLLLLVWWSATLARGLVSADASTVGAGSRGSRLTRLVAGLVAGRVGAVAVKELRYAWRDPRRKAQWASALVFGGFAPFAGLLLDSGSHGVPRQIAYFVAMPAVFAGLQTINQLGLEGPAWWYTVAASGQETDLREDALGRNLAAAVIAVPVLVGFVVVAAVVAHNPWGAVPAAGVVLGVFGSSLGVGNVTSVLLPSPVPERKSGAFGGGGAGQGAAALAGSLSSMVSSVLVSAPLAIAAVALGLLLPRALPVLIIIGPAYGWSAAALGRRIAAGRLAGRMPEVLQVVARVSGP
jgi:ABC-2 type transport system permease protein